MFCLLKISLDNSKGEKSKPIMTQEDALEYLSNKIRVTKKYSDVDKMLRQQQKRLHLLNLLETNFLPHIEDGLKAKAYYLGYMINKMLQCIKKKKFDDRDNFVNKRVDLVGNLMEDLFKINYKKTLNECYKCFKKSDELD